MKTSFTMPSGRIKIAAALGLLTVAMSACADATTEQVESAPTKLESDGSFEICEMVWVEDDVPVADGGVTAPAPAPSPDADGGLVVATPPPPAPDGFAPAGGVRVQGRWKNICRTIGRCVAGTNPINLVRAATENLEMLTKRAQALATTISEKVREINRLKAEGIDTRLKQAELDKLWADEAALQQLVVAARQHLALVERSYRDYLASCGYWDITP